MAMAYQYAETRFKMLNHYQHVYLWQPFSWWQQVCSFFRSKALVILHKNISYKVKLEGVSADLRQGVGNTTSKDKLSNLFKKSSYVLMWHYVGRNRFVNYITSQFLEHIAQFGIHYLYRMSHQTRLVSYILLNKLLTCLNVIFYRIIIIPLYMCATQVKTRSLQWRHTPHCFMI